MRCTCVAGGTRAREVSNHLDVVNTPEVAGAIHDPADGELANVVNIEAEGEWQTLVRALVRRQNVTVFPAVGAKALYVAILVGVGAKKRHEGKGDDDGAGRKIHRRLNLRVYGAAVIEGVVVRVEQ